MYSQIQHLVSQVGRLLPGMVEKLLKYQFLKLTFAAIVGYCSFTYKAYEDFRGHDHPFISDVMNYHSYLPAFFVHDDLSFSFPNEYWTTKAPYDNKIAKGTMGMAIMYTPFFLVGHTWASMSDYPTDGYSFPYYVMVRAGTLLYCLLGLVLTAATLLRFYRERDVAITIAALFLGTNLFYYTLGWGEMPHAYLFFLFSAVIFYTVRWHETDKGKYLLCIAFIGGLCVLIRPTAILILFVPVMYGLHAGASVKVHLQRIYSYKWHLAIGFLLFLLPIFPQLLYWKTYAGSWLFFSYGNGERFFFDNPHIVDFLFSYRKGWFIYTPLMFLGVVGFIFMSKSAKKFQLIILFLIPLLIYVFSSWWSWWYGGGFGQRSMIQYYSVMAIPLGAFISYFMKKWITAIPLVLICSFFVLLNLKQSRQYKNNLLHWESMTKDSYWYIFMKDSFSTAEEWQILDSMLKHPDPEAAKRGEDT